MLLAKIAYFFRALFECAATFGTYQDAILISSKSRGIASITRDSKGRYTVKLKPTYYLRPYGALGFYQMLTATPNVPPGQGVAYTAYAVAIAQDTILVSVDEITAEGPAPSDAGVCLCFGRPLTTEQQTPPPPT